jgi:hypothetical protein
LVFTAFILPSRQFHRKIHLPSKSLRAPGAVKAISGCGRAGGVVQVSAREQ